jgi:hypothetical protein
MFLLLVVAISSSSTDNKVSVETMVGNHHLFDFVLAAVPASRKGRKKCSDPVAFVPRATYVRQCVFFLSPLSLIGEFRK